MTLSPKMSHLPNFIMYMQMFSYKFKSDTCFYFLLSVISYYFRNTQQTDIEFKILILGSKIPHLWHFSQNANFLWKSKTVTFNHFLMPASGTILEKPHKQIYRKLKNNFGLKNVPFTLIFHIIRISLENSMQSVTLTTFKWIKSISKKIRNVDFWSKVSHWSHLPILGILFLKIKNCHF